MIEPGIKDLLDKARQSISAAELLFREGYTDFAASRAYYAMFYGAEALLLSRNLSFSKHSAVISTFGKEFVKTGIFETRFHHYLIDAFDLRNIGDYGTMHAVSQEKVAELIRNAVEMLAVTETYLESSEEPSSLSETIP